MEKLKDQFILNMKLRLFEVTQEQFINEANLKNRFKVGIDGEDFTGLRIPNEFYYTQACKSLMGQEIKPIKSGRFENLGVFYDSFQDKSAKVYVDSMDGWILYLYKDLNI